MLLIQLSCEQVSAAVPAPMTEIGTRS